MLVWRSPASLQIAIIPTAARAVSSFMKPSPTPAHHSIMTRYCSPLGNACCTINFTYGKHSKRREYFSPDIYNFSLIDMPPDKVNDIITTSLKAGTNIHPQSNLVYRRTVYFAESDYVCDVCTQIALVSIIA